MLCWPAVDQQVARILAGRIDGRMRPFALLEEPRMRMDLWQRSALACASAGSFIKSTAAVAAATVAVAAALLLAACEPQRAEKLVEDVSTEADVRRLFGEPKTVTVQPDGTRVMEYPRQPEGWANYVMTIGPNGKLVSLRQLLNAENFARIKPGMERAQVGKILGPQARTRMFDLKKEEVWEWRFRDGQESKIFSVTYDTTGHVTGTSVGEDPRETGGGPSR
jgi:hypothetical protein